MSKFRLCSIYSRISALNEGRIVLLALNLVVEYRNGLYFELKRSFSLMQLAHDTITKAKIFYSSLFWNIQMK